MLTTTEGSHHARARCAEQVRELLEADLTYRMRRLAAGGLGQLFADLRPWAEFDSGVLRVNTRCDGEAATRTNGLTLMPTILFDRTVVLVPEPPDHAVLLYPARGADGGPPDPALVRDDWAGQADVLLRLLECLRHPRTIDDLVRQHRIEADEVRPHLAELTNAGLLVMQRSPTKRYERTNVASALVAPSCPYCA